MVSWPLRVSMYLDLSGHRQTCQERDPISFSHAGQAVSKPTQNRSNCQMSGIRTPLRCGAAALVIWLTRDFSFILLSFSCFDNINPKYIILRKWFEVTQWQSIGEPTIGFRTFKLKRFDANRLTTVSAVNAGSKFHIWIKLFQPGWGVALWGAVCASGVRLATSSWMTTTLVINMTSVNMKPVDILQWTNDNLDWGNSDQSFLNCLLNRISSYGHYQGLLYPADQLVISIYLLGNWTIRIIPPWSKTKTGQQIPTLRKANVEIRIIQNCHLVHMTAKWWSSTIKMAKW